MPTETTPAVPMTHEERAREICAEYEMLHASFGVGQPFGTDELSRLISERLRTVDLEAYERAAKVADIASSTDVIGWDKNSNRSGRIKAGEIARAIRSLKESP